MMVELADLPADAGLLRRQLLHYRTMHPAEQVLTDQFIALLDDPLDPFVRARLQGHFTGSAWLVSADGRRTLLTHHRKLQRWLQLGGHADGDRDLRRVALREAQEESGLPALRLARDDIFDLDRHWIPARGEVPGHWHYDVRYVVCAAASEAFVVSAESLALAWRPVTELLQDADLEPSMRRMALKWRHR
jgi:8-oxo-dGTP pyrophosphatase MutT (NUDIX family)